MCVPPNYKACNRVFEDIIHTSQCIRITVVKRCEGYRLCKMHTFRKQRLQVYHSTGQTHKPDYRSGYGGPTLSQYVSQYHFSSQLRCVIIMVAKCQPN